MQYIGNVLTRRSVIPSSTAFAAGLEVGFAGDRGSAQAQQVNGQPEGATVLPLAGKVAFVTGAARGIGRADSFAEPKATQRFLRSMVLMSP